MVMDTSATAFSLGDFEMEMQEYEIVQTRKFDRIWRTGPGSSIATGVAVHGGRVYFGCGDHFIYALDADTGKLAWKFQAVGGMAYSSPTIRNGLLYFGSLDHIFYALDVESGKVAWKFKTQGPIACSPCTDSERVYFGSKDNSVYALDLHTGELCWRFETRDWVASHPVVDKDSLFIGSFDRNLYCLEKKTGSLSWKFPTQGEVFNCTPLLVHRGTVYFPSFDNFLRAADARTGRLLWKFRAGNYGMSAGTVIYRDMLLQGSRDGNLYALTLNGRLLWKFYKNLVVVPVAGHGNRIYAGAEDHILHCLDMHGREIWGFQTQGSLIGMPAFWKNRVYFGSCDCNLYAVDVGTGQEAWRFGTEGSPSYIPPAFESFEVRMKVRATPVEVEKKKAYELDFSEGDIQEGGFYRARVTYQMKTQYASKGKYQVDSDEEGF